VVTIALAAPRAAPADFLALTKPRIVTMVLVTVAAGYFLAPAGAASGAVRLLVLAHLLVGTALVAAGTNALNQVWERDTDALMRRTAGRPLPTGRLPVASAMVFAVGAGVVGVAYLWLFVNGLTATLASATLVSYVLVYTPLKRRTALATLVGAVPGALPIVGGWTAAGGALDARAWLLFALLFLWQLPHFLALGWIYREDYARAGLPTLSAGDPDGRRTFRQAALDAAALLAVSLAPTLIGMTGAFYFIGAMGLSTWLLWTSGSCARHPSTDRARRLFRATLVYLPSILLLLIVDRAP
jgi:protoheme IX farnesyltransferase